MQSAPTRRDVRQLNSTPRGKLRTTSEKSAPPQGEARSNSHAPPQASYPLSIIMECRVCVLCVKYVHNCFCQFELCHLPMNTVHAGALMVFH